MQRNLLAVDGVVGGDELADLSVDLLQLPLAQRSLRSKQDSAALTQQLTTEAQLTWALKSKRRRSAETWDPLCWTVGPRTFLRAKLRRWLPVCFTMQASLWTCGVEEPRPSDLDPGPNQDPTRTQPGPC